MNDKIFITKVKIMINESLYNKKIIDEKTYNNINEMLNKELNILGADHHQL